MRIGIRTNSESKEFERIQRNNSRTLRRLRKASKTRKLRIAFLVGENSKWSCQSLYEEFRRSQRFEPIILITGERQGSRSNLELIEKVNETYSFFKARNMNPQLAYDVRRSEYLDLRQFKPDLVFYQQPWTIDDVQSPTAISKFALGCYVPYSIAGTSEVMVHYPKTFLYGIWRHFIVSSLVGDEYKSWMTANKESLIITGHPKLDVYNNNEIINEMHYIIYAPHFATKNSVLKLSTFDWSGRYILDFAKRHTELRWVFKPHPLFRSQIIKDGILTENEISSYYDEWARIGMIYDQGDYFSIFKNSDALITDCSSFLSEYLPTKMPVIHLISENMVTPNPLSRIASSHYYKVHNITELEFYLNEVIINKNDPQKEKRIEDIRVLDLDGISASSKILNHLKGELGIYD
ncbi:MAG: CDP-glycerol glycerophosphotransferase family protein [Methanomassiliicoccales archaeon]|nr:CDP-glycerol glycerophosphotransferase family protein [Methanomassiliicoccales archaeon]